MTSTQTYGKRCKGKSKTGQPCGGYAVAGSQYCFIHDPKLAAERKAARTRGGLARVIAKVSGDRIEISDMASVLKLINAVIADTWMQDNTSARSRALLAAGDSAVKVIQAGVLEERVARLEQMMEEAKK